MKFYIPEHLKKLKIVEQVSKVVESYVPTDSGDSFDDYRWYLQNDPIKRFLGLERKFPSTEGIDIEDEEELEEYVNEVNNYYAEMNYLTKLFYTVKGTKKVIEYAQKFIPSLSTATIDYSLEKLKIDIGSIDDIQDDIYVQYLEDFFNALLIFKLFDCNIRQITYELDDPLTLAVGVGIQPYKINQIVHLDLEKDFSKTLSSYLGKTITLSMDKKLNSGKNSLCLPFSCNDLSKTSLANCSVKLIQATVLDGNKVSLTLSDNVNRIIAGSFYVVESNSSIDTLTFEDVTIEMALPVVQSNTELIGSYISTTKKSLYETDSDCFGVYFKDDNYTLQE